jgi:hypothetical protein
MRWHDANGVPATPSSAPSSGPASATSAGRHHGLDGVEDSRDPGALQRLIGLLDNPNPDLPDRPSQPD